MKRNQTIDILLQHRVSAILRANDTEQAAKAMRAAVQGGFRVIEFTLTTPGALDLIQEFAGNPDLCVGAGTVLQAKDVDAVREAGARFAVSPVCDPKIIQQARDSDLATIPGTFTATEMWAAHQAGADFVKLFPAPADVATYVASILGPLPMLRIFPTNGVTADNLGDVLAAGAAGAGFVKPLFRPEDMKSGNFEAVEQRARQIHDELAKISGTPSMEPAP